MLCLLTFVQQHLCLGMLRCKWLIVNKSNHLKVGMVKGKKKTMRGGGMVKGKKKSMRVGGMVKSSKRRG